MAMLYVTLAAQAGVLLVFNFTAHSQVMSAVCIFLMAAAAGFGLQSPDWAGAILSVIALILAVISGLTDKTGHNAAMRSASHSD